MKILNLLLMAAALVLTSCLEITSTITVSKDGTATIEENIILGAQLTAMAQGEGNQFQSLVVDKAKAEERAKKLGEGVTVKSHEEVKTPEGKSGSKVVYAVADISKLKYVPFEPEQESKTSPATEPMTFALNGSTLTLSNPEVEKKRGGGPSKPKKTPEQMAMVKAQIGMMKPMLAGLHMSVKVKSANGIASSDATNLNDGAITLMDLNFDKLLENTDAFASFMEATNDGISIADAAAKFTKVEGLTLEGKKVITVELK